MKFQLSVWLLLICFSSFAQTETELIKSLSNKNHDTVQARILLQLCALGVQKNDTTYGHQLIEFTRKRLKDPAINDSTKYRLTSNLMAGIDNMAFLTQQAGNGLKAINMWEEVLDINKGINNESVLGTTLLNIGYVHDHKGNIPVALDYYHKALYHLERTKYVDGLGAVFNNLASLYNKQGDKDKAILFYQKGLDLHKDDNNIGVAIMLYNLAGLYWDKKETEKALALWERSYKVNVKLNNKTGIAAYYTRLSDVEASKGNYNGAIEHLNKAMKLQEEMNNKMGIERVYVAMGKIYFDKKDYKKAKEVSEIALKMAQEFKYPADLMNISLGLAQIYAAMGDYKKAYTMEVYYKDMSDSVSSENLKRIAMRKDFEYAFQKQVAQDSIKSVEEKKVFDAEIKHQKTQSNALYIGIGLIGIFSVFMYNRFRITQKQKQIIEKQKELVDDKQKEILQSIQYAKRIQQAMMPSEKMIRKSLKL